MKKVLLLLSLIFAIVAIVFQDEPTAQTLGAELEGSNRLLAAYRQTGAKFEDYTITGWVQLPQSSSEQSFLKNTAWKAAEKLGAESGELVETFREDKGFQGLRLAGRLSPGTSVEIFVQTMNYENMSKAETYLLITFYSKTEPEKLIYIRNLINEAFNTSGRAAKIATIIKGNLPGKLTIKARENLHGKVFTFLGAKKSEGISNGDLVSWSGYSSQLPDRLELANKAININVASRYNSTTDSTMLYMGTPIISVEY